MLYKLKTKVTKNFQNNQKNSPSPPKNNKITEMFNYNTQTPLFKMLMDNAKIKKIHLIKSSVTISKEDNYYKNNKYNNFNYTPQKISFKILEAKYNMTPKLYSQKIIFNLVWKKRGHLLATYHEILLRDNSLKEFMKREYRYEECLKKIPKYYDYYKNYLRFFCHPTFVDYFTNKRMVKHMEKIAQLFYNKNYLGNLKNEGDKGNQILIFNKKVIREIEKVSVEINNNLKKVNQISAKNNNSNPSFPSLEITPILTIMEANNCIQNSKSIEFFDNVKNIVKEESSKNILFNSGQNNNTNFTNIQNKINASNSLETLINEIKEDTNNKSNNKSTNRSNNKSTNKSSNTRIEQEQIKKYIRNEEISSKNKNVEIASSSNNNNKKTKKLNGFKYNSNKIYLNYKNSNKKMTTIEQINNRKEEKRFDKDRDKPSILTKKTINNLNININQLIINNKITPNCQENARSKEYNKLYYKDNNSPILKELNEIFKYEKRKNNNEIMNSNSNNKNTIINIKDLKTIYSSGTGKILTKLNRVNSMERITSLSKNKKDVKKRSVSNLRKEKRHKNISLLKLGGDILENQGKITLLLRNSSSKNLSKQFNFTKINTKRGKFGISNDVSLSTNKNYCIISSDRNDDKRRIMSNSKNSQKKIFRSGFNFNLTNDKYNSGANSPHNSIENKYSNKINNLKFNLNLKDIIYINNKEIPLVVKKEIGRNLFGGKKNKEENKLRLKNFDCIAIGNIQNKVLFSPRNTKFRNSPISIKSK